ncbi:MAG: phage tail protein [Acidimicrobiia bacterium]
MAIERDDPYECSNFTVDLGDGTRLSFSRVQLPEADIDEVAHRSGADKSHEEQKQPGLVRYGHLVLQRGLNGSLHLWQWWDQARDGQPNIDRNVTVTLLDEQDREVWTWRFLRAFPVNYRITPLDATSSEILTEELTLTFDSMSIE